MSNKFNDLIRQYIKNKVRISGCIQSKIVVEDTKRAFPIATSHQIAGNLSSLCCYFNDLNYDEGILSYIEK